MSSENKHNKRKQSTFRNCNATVNTDPFCTVCVMESLTELCIHKIASELMLENPRVEWKSFHVSEDLLQRIVEVLVQKKKITSKLLHTLSTCPTEIRSLALTGCSTLDPSIFDDLPPKSAFSSLRHLDLKGCKLVNKQTLSRVALLFTDLQNIILSGCAEINDECIEVLTSSCTQLQMLKLRNCFKITDVAVSAVATRCPQMQYLDLKGCIRVTDKSIIKISDNLTELKALNLKQNQRVSNKGVLEIARNCTSLTSINLKNSNKITDDAIQELGSPHLLKLNVAFCDSVTSNALVKVAKKSSNLQQLQMEYVELGDREGTLTLIENCKNLKKLHFFNDASVFDDKVFQYVAQNCTGLEKLEIGCNDNREATCAISSPSIENLAKNLIHLKVLDIGHVTLTPKAMHCIGTYCKELYDLTLRKCVFGDEVLHKIAETLPTLRRLAILTNPNITDEGVAHVAQGKLTLQQVCTELEYMRLISCIMVGDITAEALSKCSKLEVLCMTSCKLTEVGIQAIAKSLHYLREMDFSHCKYLKPSVISDLCSAACAPVVRKFSLEGLLWVTNQNVQSIMNSFPNLHHLFLSGCDFIDARAITVNSVDLAVHTTYRVIQMLIAPDEHNEI